MHNFKELNIWKRSRILVALVYKLTKEIDKSEQFNLIQQIRKCAVSTPSNIAEGCGRGTNKQLSHFLDIAVGSLCELETQLILAIDLNYLKEENLTYILTEITDIRKMIFGFKKNLRI